MIFIDKVLKIITEQSEDQFQLRLNKSEGLGLLTTRTGQNFLILDSEDYWFDFILDKYPAKYKCECKNEWFRVNFRYIYREFYNDIQFVKLNVECTYCLKHTEPLIIEIQYSPTQHLISQPIKYCANPKLKTKTECLSLYWNKTDLLNFLYYCNEKLNLKISVWFWNGQKRILSEIIPNKNSVYTDYAELEQYLEIYIHSHEIKIKDFIEYQNDEVGVIMHEHLWRKHDIFNIQAPFHSIGLAGENGGYTMNYSLSFIQNGTVIVKPIVYAHYVDSIIIYLSRHYHSRRGKNCFDHEGLFFDC